MSDQDNPHGHPVTQRPLASEHGAARDRSGQSERPTRRPQMPGGVAMPDASSQAVRIPEPANDPRFPPAPASVAAPVHRPSVKPGATPSAASRWLKRVLLLVAVLGGAAIVAIAALQIRLGKGPIDVPQLVGPIERGLSKELGISTVTVGNVALYRAKRTGRLEFRLTNLQLFDETGAPAVQVPTAAIDISRNALVRGGVAPKRIDLIGPRLEMSYGANSGLKLRFAGFQATAEDETTDNPLGIEIPAMTGAEASTGIPDRRRAAIGLVEILQDTFKAARDRKAATSFLKSVGVRDAVIVLKTANAKTTWTAPNPKSPSPFSVASFGTGQFPIGTERRPFCCQCRYCHWCRLHGRFRE